MSLGMTKSSKIQGLSQIVSESNTVNNIIIDYFSRTGARSSTSTTSTAVSSIKVCGCRFLLVPVQTVSRRETLFNSNKKSNRELPLNMKLHNGRVEIDVLSQSRMPNDVSLT